MQAAVVVEVDQMATLQHRAVQVVLVEVEPGQLVAQVHVFPIMEQVARQIQAVVVELQDIALLQIHKVLEARVDLE
jgi:hypothetical protein